MSVARSFPCEGADSSIGNAGPGWAFVLLVADKSVGTGGDQQKR